MEKSVYILNLTRHDEHSIKTTEQIIASQDDTLLYDKLAIKAKELSEQVGLMETNKGKDIISSAYFKILVGKQKMYSWELQINSKVILELSISKLEMI